MSKKKKMPANYYIDNKKFTKAMVEYSTEVQRIQKEQNLKSPKDVKLKASDYIGKCILQLCNGLSYRFNFIDYTYRDEMCYEGQIACVKALKNFDTSATNAFGYFNMIAGRAFITKIRKEKNQQRIKYKMMFNMDIDSILDDSVQNETSEFSSDMINVYNSIAAGNLKDEDFAIEKPRRKRKEKISPLTAFL